MKTRPPFVSRLFEKAVTWLVTLALVSTQFPLLAGIVALLTLCFPNHAQAARLGTSTASAGSAPPPAATTVDSFQPDLFTGRATTGIPIAVPPGRKGVQPSLALGYSSSSRNGWLGVGWSLDLGFIERSTRKGVLKYDGFDSFSFFLQNVNSDLVRLADGTFRAKDEGAFLKAENLGNNGWKITDKSGTQYLFGRDDAARVLNGTNVYRWHLDKVVDVNGNSLTINYVKFDGLAYPSVIDYTAHETMGTAPANRVNFILQDRPDIESSYRSGFLLKTSKRLASIETLAKVSGTFSLARRYEFTYRQSQRTGRSLLVSARQIGTDGSTALPPVIFDYQDAAPTYSKISNQRTNGIVGWNVRGASYDCGHDNYGCVHPYGGGPCGPANYGTPVVVRAGSPQDVFGVHVDVGANGNVRVTGNLHDRQIHAWTAVFVSSAKNISLPLVGGWDVCCMWVEDSTGIHGPYQPGSIPFAAGWSLIHLVAYNQNDDRTDGFGIGGDLVSQVDVLNPAPLTEPQLAGDVDGNGVTDIIDFNSASGNWSAYCAQLCPLAQGLTWLSSFGNNSTLPVLGDWNGDGRTDVATYDSGNWRFATSTGSNFIADSLPPLTFGVGSPLTGDFNGDGIMDIGTFDFGIWRFALGTGTNFVIASASNAYPYYTSCRDVFEHGASTGNGTYTIDPDGPAGQAPIIVDGFMGVPGGETGGWTKLTLAVAGSLLNTDPNFDREYLYWKPSIGKWYRSPKTKLVWNWTDGQGQDLYGTYYYSDGGSFAVTPSGEHTLFGVSGSSGPSVTPKCLIYYDAGKDANNAQVNLCQDIPNVFAGSACQSDVTVYIRETAVRSVPASTSNFVNQLSLGVPPPFPPSQTGWTVRMASYDCGHDNYGVIPPYANPPCGPPNYSVGTVSAGQTVNVGGVAVSVDNSGNISIPAGQDRDFWVSTAVYLRHSKTVLLSENQSWDVAGIFTEPQGGNVSSVGGGPNLSVSLNAGWTRIHIRGYNQNQGINCALGGSLASQVDFMAPDIISFPSRSLQQLTGDFNGDGLTDVAILETNEITMALSDGRSFQLQSPMTVSGLPTNGVQSVDFNGDGLSDLAYYDATNGVVMVAYNTNGGFAAPVNLSASLVFVSGTAQDQMQVADFNGDSLPDPAVLNSTTADSEIALSQGGPPDLLVGINNGLGGSTAITFAPANSLGNHFLPFLTPVVTETRTFDGLGNAYTNKYAYTGGFYDAIAKEFRGFSRVDVRDMEANIATTYFYQDDVFKGRPQSSEFRDSQGRLFMQTTNTFDAVSPYPGTDAKFVPLIQTDSYNYDGAGTFKHTRNRMSFDAYGNVIISISDGDVTEPMDDRSAVTTYTLNTNDWILNRPSLVQSFDRSNNVVAQRRFYYDNAASTATAPAKGNLTREEEWLDHDRSSPQNRWIATTMAYDAYGNVLTVTDALNHSVTNTYDSATRGFLVQVANPLGHIRTMVYDPRFGHVTSSTDQNSITTSSEYDALGRIIKVIGPLDTPALPTTRYDYDLSTNPSRVTQYTRVQSGQAKELVSYIFTDGLARTIQVRSPAQAPDKQIVTGTVEFDSKGRVIRQWTPYLDVLSTTIRTHTLPDIAPLLAPPVFHTYDPVGRLITTTDPDGSQTSIAYDHWTVTTTDAKQHVKKRTSDAFGRLVQVQEFNGLGTNATLYATTTYTYDSRDNLVQLTDAVGNTTSLEYDSLNRKISMTEPDMGVWTYAYDDVDKLAAQTDARGVSILFTYDSLNRQTRKDYLIPPNINVPTNQPPVIYTYDNPGKNFSKGKLTEIFDASGSSSFAYDVLGRLITEQKTVDATSYTIQRNYDLLGRLTALTYPNNDVAAYTYNDQGGIQTITLQSTNPPVQPIINTVDYNAAGQITKMVYGNGVTTDYTYSPQTLRLDKLKSVGPGGVLQDFTYSFDSVGNVTAITDAVHSASQSFTYDSLNRLATANGARYGNFAYAYNQIGNMTGKEGVTQNYGSLNNRPHAVTATSSGLALTYDANGNLASKSGPNRPAQSLVFDAENRLVEVGSPTPYRKLDPGWNFVSFPQIVGEVPVTAALTNFAGNCEQLTRFNTRSNYFESFVNLPGTNQFTTVNATNGYALFVTNAAGIYLRLGDAPAPASPCLLPTGTNFLAGPPDIMSATNWLAGLIPGVDYDQVLGLNSNTGITAPVTIVHPGEAYYVRMLRSASWTPPTAAQIANPSTVRFVYDGDGGRVKKITWSGTTLFLAQGYEVSPTGQSTLYVFAGGRRIAAKEQNGNLRIYHSDHLGSANVITDQSGATIEVTENTPYGSVSRLQGSANVSHKFTGQRFDDETGFYFYNTRYYDPEIGRFISPDPFQPAPDNPQALDRYAYALNNPVAFNDPSGHFFQFVFAVVFAALKAAVVSAAFAAFQAVVFGGDIALAAKNGAIRGAVQSLPFIGSIASHFVGPNGFKRPKEGLEDWGASIVGNIAGRSGAWFFKGDNVRLLVQRSVSASVAAKIRADDPRTAATFAAVSTASTIAARYYKNTVGYKPTLQPATQGAEAKQSPGMPESPNVNNIGFAALRDEQNPNTEPDTFASHPFKFFVSGGEGGLLSTTLNLVPGFNSFAGLHDAWLGSMPNQSERAWVNFPSMVPALIINYTALLDGYVEFSHETYKQQTGD